MLKILSWNIMAGGGSRLRSIAKAIADINANVLTLSEYRNNDSGITLRNYLLKLGYRHQVVTSAIKNDNSVIIASKIPFRSEHYPKADETYSNNIVAVHFDAFSVMGVYLPHKKKHKLLPFITEVVKESDSPWIIAGDYNTGKNGIDQKGKSFWYTDELVKLEKQGCLDAFRLVHGDVEEYSWYSHQGNGYRYDHTYITDALRPIVKDCYYIHKYREDKLSDHSPMIIELG